MKKNLLLSAILILTVLNTFNQLDNTEKIEITESFELDENHYTINMKIDPKSEKYKSLIVNQFKEL